LGNRQIKRKEFWQDDGRRVSEAL